MSYDAYKTEFRVELQYLRRELYAVRGTANSLRFALALLAAIDVTHVKRESLSKDEYGIAYLVINYYFEALDRIEDLERQETALIHAIGEFDEISGFSNVSVGDPDQPDIDITYAHLEAADKLNAASRRHARQCRAERPSEKEVVTPAAERKAVAHLVDTHGTAK